MWLGTLLGRDAHHLISALSRAFSATHFTHENSQLLGLTGLLPPAASTTRRSPVMTHGIRIQLFTVRSFSLQFARKLYSELRKVFSLDSDSIRQYRLDRTECKPANPMTQSSEHALTTQRVAENTAPHVFACDPRSRAFSATPFADANAPNMADCLRIQYSFNAPNMAE